MTKKEYVLLVNFFGAEPLLRESFIYENEREVFKNMILEQNGNFPHGLTTYEYEKSIDER